MGEDETTEQPDGDGVVLDFDGTGLTDVEYQRIGEVVVACLTERAKIWKLDWGHVITALRDRGLAPNDPRWREEVDMLVFEWRERTRGGIIPAIEQLLTSDPGSNNAMREAFADSILNMANADLE